jgi:hypothetical protein
LPRQEARAGIGLLAALAVVGLLGAGALLAGCHRRHVSVDAVPQLGYPACRACATCADGGLLEPGSLVAQGHLRSGPLSVEKNVSERFELRRTSCGTTFRARQEWPLAVSDVEVRYDDSLSPIWAWKRMTIPGSKREDGNADIRRYELRTGDTFIVHRDDRGKTTFELLLPGGRLPVSERTPVGAVIAPGRGMLTAWLWRAHLPVGGKVRALVLDFREAVESLEMATLQREQDRFEPSLGKTVRVYIFYGREAVFADDRDVVIGDLAGLRPSESLSTPEPPPLPSYGPPDPEHSP